MKKDIEHEIIEELGIIGRSENGSTKRLVLMKWGKHPPAYEVRAFAPDGTPWGRPALTPEEFENLKEILI